MVLIIFKVVILPWEDVVDDCVGDEEDGFLIPLLTINL